MRAFALLLLTTLMLHFHAKSTESSSINKATTVLLEENCHLPAKPHNSKTPSQTGLLGLEAESKSNEISHTACGSYIYNSITYKKSGTYSHTYKTEQGLDSIVTLHLTINQPVTTNIDTTVCGRIFYYNDYEYTQNTTVQHTFTSSTGCDSIVNISITLLGNGPIYSHSTIKTCNSYELNGEVYTETGIYAQRTTTNQGCDSTIILNLKITKPPVTKIDTVTCGTSITYNDILYNKSGTYTQRLTTKEGCDSLVELSITILNNTIEETNLTANACGSFDFNGTVYSRSGRYTYRTKTVHGCDSFVNLNLTIKEVPTLVIDTSICGSTFFFNNMKFTKSGAYTQRLKSQSGCDTILTLNLTLHENGYFKTIKHAIACRNYTYNGFFYTKSGSYKHHFVSQAGCDSIVTLKLIVQRPKNIYIYDTINQGETYSFYGDELTETGIYYKATDDEDICSDLAHLHLMVIDINNEYTAPPSTLFLPNALAPNSQTPKTQHFIPAGHNIKEYQIWIYDSFGNTIWHSDRLTEEGAPAEAWDGKHNGVVMQAGVYTYKVFALFADGEEISEYGSINLIH